MIVYGQWHGGSSYAPSWREDREVFPSIDAAVQALRDRRALGHHFPQHFEFVYKPPADALTPVVDESSYIDLYATPDSDDIWHRIEFGPKGGVRRG